MPPLEDLIIEEIKEKGPITFARFMELALYHPEMGYYGSGRARIGKAGDFYTSPHVSPMFGKLLAEVYVKVMDSLRVTSCAFVEMGAGEGWFARDFLEGLRRYHHREYQNCEYVIVERSEGMRARQEETLGPFRGRVRWHREVGDVPGPITGIFFSNELVDSFPFHRVRREGEGLKEVMVSVSEGALCETMGPITRPELALHFNRLGLSLCTGATTEVNLFACDWIRSVAAKLGRGFVITVDYGYPAYEYYLPERGRGTFMCYHGHTASEEPYANIGEQDITAHVDFTSLAAEGKEAGLDPVLFTDQTSFLLEALGGLEGSMLGQPGGEDELVQAGQGVKALVHPEWMGGTFKVLVQSMDAAPGRAFGNVRNRLDDLWIKGPSDSVRFF